MNRAGCVLVDPTSFNLLEADEAYQIINNWRSSHSFPLNTFQIGLRNKAKQVDDRSLVAQRLKRLSSIGAKLERFPDMKLSQMQDIAGCRAIVESVPKVNQLVRLYERSDIKHKLVHKDDYIAEPKASGYRSIHLIYKYYSDKKSKSYNDLKIEVQLRSTLQHAWATAVETVGTFIQQALKSSQGEKDWLRFFELMGTAIAMRERTAPVPETPTNRKELKQELQSYAQKLDVVNHLRIYGAALQNLEEVGAKDAYYFLLELDPSARRVRVTGYAPGELEKASKDYMAIERNIVQHGGGVPIRDAVLVSVESVAALKRAYPNYFLDMHKFIETVSQAIT